MRDVGSLLQCCEGTHLLEVEEDPIFVMMHGRHCPLVDGPVSQLHIALLEGALCDNYQTKLK
jgi:hypothetical protein